MVGGFETEAAVVGGFVGFFESASTKKHPQITNKTFFRGLWWDFWAWRVVFCQQRFCKNQIAHIDVVSFCH